VPSYAATGYELPEPDFALRAFQGEAFLRVPTSIQRELALTAIGRGLSVAKARDLLRSSEVGIVLLASISIGYRSRATARWRRA
jgi:hypothetical protein